MTHPLSPTRVLPALAILHACSAVHIREALRALRDVYFPYAPSTIAIGVVPVLKQTLSEFVPALRSKRTARLVYHDGVPDSGYASAEEDEQNDETRDEDAIDGDGLEEGEALDLLRSDELERGYAIKWLTGLVKRGDAWVSGTPSSEEQEARAMCVEEASRQLARFAGDDAPEEALTRTFVFPLCVLPCRRCYFDCWDAASPITVELNDAPVDGFDHTAVGLQSWGSAIIFAELICSNPERYLGALHPCTPIPTAAARPRRILELGAGTGLLSILTAQIFSRTSVQAEITATDYHSSVLENLVRNVQHNPSAVNVSVEKLDWCAEDGAGGGLYDVVLAADVVYYPEHARWIRGCVGQTLGRGGVFWMIIPVRTIGRHEGLGETVEEAFPVVDEGDRERGSGSGEQLAIVRREEVEKVDGVGRADERGYTLFEIRWV